MMIVLFLTAFAAVAALMLYAAIYVVPFLAGLLIFFWALNTGAGGLGAVVLGIIGAVAVFLIGQKIITSARSPWLRIPVLLLFVLPPAWVGYDWIRSIAEYTGTTSPLWQQLFAIVGAVIFGGAALVCFTDGAVYRTPVTTPPDQTVEPEIIDAEWTEPERPAPTRQYLAPPTNALPRTGSTSSDQGSMSQ